MAKFKLTTMEHELAEMIVDVLRLEIEPEEIDPEAALFNDGLELDSIDALELGVHISKNYKLQITAQDEETQRIFASLRALSTHVQNHSGR